MEEPDLVIEVPITDVFDLHSFASRDAKSALEAYLEEASLRGFRRLRIIHGRGIGMQREMVRKLLSRTKGVIAYGDAPLEAGGWGATIVDLEAPDAGLEPG
jgi:dsDNA-specific endonuclease/ATPase MutS2